jgi:hypothetical protein
MILNATYMAGTEIGDLDVTAVGALCNKLHSTLEGFLQKSIVLLYLNLPVS